MRTHVVNNAMAVKTPGVQYVLTGWQEHKDAVGKTIEMLDKFHGTAVGIFTGDEHYAGKDPTQGTELCAVVEYMFSLENLTQILGDPAFGDRLEMIAYNALPGTFSADMWQHQYDQQANQVLCTIAKRHWTNNGDDANIFGLEPNYGCCTANLHQGWPKFAANLWMATADEGLAAVAYGPCEVKAKVRGGQEVTIGVETDYPWDDTIRATVHLSDAAAFPLKFRIPAWAEGVSVHINGEADHAEPVFPQSHRIGDDIGRNAGAFRMRFNHTAHEIMIGGRFVHETIARLIDADRARFAAIEHEMREDCRRTILPLTDRNRCPEGIVGAPRAIARAEADSMILHHPGMTGRGRGIGRNRLMQHRRALFRAAVEAAGGGNHTEPGRDPSLGATRCQHKAGNAIRSGDQL